MTMEQLPPSPSLTLADLVRQYIEPGADAVREATEAYAQAIAQQRHPSDVWVQPRGSAGWQFLGYITELPAVPIVCMDPGRDGFLVWPRKFGKTAAVSVDVLVADGLRAVFDVLAVAHRADLDRRLRRLADDLGHFEPHVRREFAAVQQVLEASGIGDGYGQLTLTQPVRPPVEQPNVPRLVAVYPGLLDRTRRDPPGTPLRLTMRSLPRT